MKLVTLRPIEMSDWERVHEWASTEPACRFQPWGFQAVRGGCTGRVGARPRPTACPPDRARHCGQAV